MYIAGLIEVRLDYASDTTLLVGPIEAGRLVDVGRVEVLEGLHVEEEGVVIVAIGFVPAFPGTTEFRVLESGLL